MNDDTISRQAAIAYAISGKTREFDGDKWIRVSEVRESLQTMPSAERRGRWIDNEFGAYCSNCGLYAYRSQGIPWKSNYCPNCGARMEVE